MKKRTLLALSLLAAMVITPAPASAQALPDRAVRRDIPITNAIRQAMQAGTRDSTGTPGASYWQLETDFTIHASLDPATQTITGEETVVVHNNSSSALSSIFLRLDHNIFRPQNPQGSSVPAEQTDGMVMTRIAVDGHEVDLTAPPAGRGDPARLAAQGLTQTLARITLAEPIAPGTSATLEMAWHTKLPGGPTAADTG